jgi:ketosteroid isomerase-like protein
MSSSVSLEGCLRKEPEDSPPNHYTGGRKMFTKKFSLLLCWVLVPVLLTACGKPQEQDPVSLVQAFYDAANAEDIDAFMELVADDAEIEWGREGLVIGKEDIRRHAEVLFLDFDFTFVLSDFQVDGNRVTFNHKMILDNTQTVMEQCADEVIVEGGKIKSERMVSCVYP